MRFVDREDFVAHVAAHLGATALPVDRVCEVVLVAFARCLSPAERDMFASELPSSFRALFEHAHASTALPVEEQLVALGLTVGRAREAVASVCHVLGEQLTDDMLGRLQRALPAWIAVVLVRPAPESTLITSRAAGRHDTLAEGAPGSHTAVSESRADRTQRASVAADNPHGDSKLSSAAGTTQERERETLAEGHLATRPLGTSRG